MTDEIQAPSEQSVSVVLTRAELSATIEAFNVADEVMGGRPPLKNGSPVQEFVGGTQFRHVNGAGTTAWRKFIHAESRRI